MGGFQLPEDWVDDPRLASLSKAQMYDLTRLLCLASKGRSRGTIHLSDAEIASYLRLSAVEWSEMRSTLLRQKIICETVGSSGRGIRFEGWPAKGGGDPHKELVEYPPTVEDVREELRRWPSRAHLANGSWPEMFLNSQVAVGWMAGRSPVKDWRAHCRAWADRETMFRRARVTRAGVTAGDMLARNAAALDELEGR